MGWQNKREITVRKEYLGISKEIKMEEEKEKKKGTKKKLKRKEGKMDKWQEQIK